MSISLSIEDQSRIDRGDSLSLRHSHRKEAISNVLKIAKKRIIGSFTEIRRYQLALMGVSSQCTDEEGVDENVGMFEDFHLALPSIPVSRLSSFEAQIKRRWTDHFRCSQFTMGGCKFHFFGQSVLSSPSAPYSIRSCSNESEWSQEVLWHRRLS